MSDFLKILTEVLPYIILYAALILSAFFTLVGFLSAILHCKDMIDYHKIQKRGKTEDDISNEYIQQKKHLSDIAPAKIKKMLIVGICSVIILFLSADWKEGIRQSDFMEFYERHESEISSIISENPDSERILIDIPNEDFFYVIKPNSSDGRYQAVEKGFHSFSKVISLCGFVFWAIMIIFGLALNSLQISWKDYFRMFFPKNK